ncbi:hypothetical protein [uncultured Bacteroides sp.]|uniref:hypothetical protein n=1 Tax=uncultured Bacteroides sp. TaxID=162156 RepID=UPI002AAADCF2|nr:hypothetical protein [uncultured Bacteroides sp.]
MSTYTSTGGAVNPSVLLWYARMECLPAVRPLNVMVSSAEPDCNCGVLLLTKSYTAIPSPISFEYLLTPSFHQLAFNVFPAELGPLATMIFNPLVSSITRVSLTPVVMAHGMKPFSVTCSGCLPGRLKSIFCAVALKAKASVKNDKSRFFFMFLLLKLFLT